MKADFYYHLTHRPPSIGTHPDEGFQEIALSCEHRKDVDGVLSWGVLRYDRPLTKEELDSYEMQPYDEKERLVYRAMVLAEGDLEASVGQILAWLSGEKGPVDDPYIY